MFEDTQKNNKASLRSSFEEISGKEWDTAVVENSCSSVLMSSSWGKSIADFLPFITPRYFRYGNSHLIRLAEIDGRLTTVPFSDGSDVISLDESTIDLSKLQSDLREQFSLTIRLRINERFAQAINGDETNVAAHEDIVELEEPIIPRIRKTLRHTLSKPIEGAIRQSKDSSDIEAAYKLYLKHMRNVRNFSLPKSLLTSLIRDHGGELWVWSQNSVPEAIAIFLPSDSEVQYSLSAASPKALRAHAPHHLVYTALEHYRSKGIKRASLGATGKGSALEVFKRGWRGKQYSIYEIGMRTGRTSRTSSVRNLVRYVPLALYPLLTTKVGKYFF